MSAVAQACFSGSPLVVLGGRAATYSWGRGALQELDHPSLLGPVTKRAATIGSVDKIADEVDENLYLASRNLGKVLVIEPRYADPLSLVHYKKVLVTKGAIDKLKEMFA